ncbi:MAG TPA: efflux transporter outer membrane subunit [Pirellulales bacterium]|nr:efflux transporter outer membrane subunit [Pirellulales bacterium]
MRLDMHHAAASSGPLVPRAAERITAERITAERITVERITVERIAVGHWRGWIPRVVLAALLAGFLSGCTPCREYIQNGFKVGPNYCKPAAPVADQWIDASDARVGKGSENLSHWWTLFKDPALNGLICNASQQNLTLREAGFRILQARAQLAIDTGNLFPQEQAATGSYTRTAISRETATGQNISQRFFSQYNYGFNLTWELDFWGRFRRAIEADSATLDASIEGYDDVLVTLLADVATNYTALRTTEQRIKTAQDNVTLQRETLAIVQARFNAGTTSELDVSQAKSTLASTQAQIPQFEIALRQATNQICILLGMPPEELRRRLGPGPIPTAPKEVAVGIPADLLRRCPNVRRAERQAAAQSAVIGIAESEFYPHIAINGTIGGAAEQFKNLGRPDAMTGSIGPSFQWNILNYGRLLNNVRLQEARFQELIAAYQETVLEANRDAENGLVGFLKSEERTAFQATSVNEAEEAVKIALAQYRAGTIDFTRVTQVEQTLVLQQDTLAQAQGEIINGLITLYRAVGGGWEIRIEGCQPMTLTGEPLPAPAPAVEPLPSAKPEDPILSAMRPLPEIPAANQLR